jgi:integrase
MPTITEFIGTMSVRTAAEYKTTARYLSQWRTKKKRPTFANYLRSLGVNHNTIVKHCKQAKSICKHCNLDYEIESLTLILKPPPIFSDNDFANLYEAFQNVEWPKFIQIDHEYRYWQCILHFAAITALRREAILGLNIDNVNFKELYVTIPPNIDKKNTERYKPITQELADEILQLRRFYDNSQIIPAQRKRIFPWTHGNKRWYMCWHAAEEKLGKRFHLHDLKRYAGTLALQAGATPMELQQHLDHANLTTTLKHYCRPQTRELVQRIKVPIPKKNLHARLTPLFTEPELHEILEDILERRLRELGITELPKIVVDEFGNPGIDTRTTKETLEKAKAQGLRLLKGGDL